VPNLLNPIYLDESMFPDPIISAAESEIFESLHLQMCAETGADPAYVSVRRVVDWLKNAALKVKAANA
jgi:hypothetical protein